MRLVQDVTWRGETRRVEVRPVDVVKWERATKRRITEGVGMGDMAAIVHMAYRRQGWTDQAFDAWLDDLDGMESVDDEDAEDTEDPEAP